jgi:predicted  nucleic acid-binding Zn-ribbon protein
MAIGHSHPSEPSSIVDEVIDLRAKVAELVRQVEELQQRLRDVGQEHFDFMATLSADNARLAKDAERYLWILRNSESDELTWRLPVIRRENATDDRCMSDIIDDAAIAQAKQAEGDNV